MKNYIIGFSLSIVLTLIVFLAVYMHALSSTALYSSLIVCAILQLFVQLYFFLHVGKESGPHWNLTALAFALVVVIVLVGGTLWIMQNLQHGNMMEPFEDGIVTPQTER